MKAEIEAMQGRALAAIEAAPDLEALKQLRLTYLGKKGELTQILRGMGKLSPEERPLMGQVANRAREAIEAALTEKEAAYVAAATEARLAAERLDITLPGRPLARGHLHLLAQVRTQLEELFIAMGYRVVEGPEVESDYYNFEALNLPKGHPARDAQDSLFITEEVMLRTHTSPMQIRYMEQVAPELPVRIVVPGRVFRRDAEDATHSIMFHQLEGLVVDHKISLADLKGTLLSLARGLFGEGAEVRLRPSYFPFTEPSVEMDFSCPFCGGAGCRTCKQSGWIEVGGAGLVHPKVLEYGGYDPKKVSGFAFGMGIERLAMLLYGIDDIRTFYQNDLRFTAQY